MLIYQLITIFSGIQCARWMLHHELWYATSSRLLHLQVEAVENHMPEIVIVDEIGTEAEALACRTIAERGVQLIGTAHGQMLENLIKNPTLSDLIGGICSVTLGTLCAPAEAAAAGHPCGLPPCILIMFNAINDWQVMRRRVRAEPRRAFWSERRRQRSRW